MEDAAYQMLSDARRREVLCRLLDEVSVDVSTLLADGGETQGDDRISLHHRHLPMLTDSGYVTWDTSSGTVTRGPRFDVVRPLVAFHVAEMDASTANPTLGDVGSVD